MKVIDLPTQQIQWLMIQLNMIERKAFKMGYIETVALLDKRNNVTNLIDDPIK